MHEQCSKICTDTTQLDGSGRLATAAIKALKVSADQPGTEIDSSWGREARALEDIKGLRHEHIIEVKAIIKWEGKGNFFMFQWADGGSLRDFYQRHPNPVLSAKLVREIVSQLWGLSSALDQLHNYQKGENDSGESDSESYRHGDLKPENILRFENGTTVGFLRISDLGLAKHHIDETGLRGPTVTRYGTPLYEPPEVILEADVARSRQYDIWSMGCVFLELLVWLMYGYGELEKFNLSMNSALGNSSPYWVMEDTGGPGRSASVHPIVVDMMEIMRKDLLTAGTTAIGDLLQLIKTRLLVVPLPRSTASFRRSRSSIPAPPGCRAKAADLENDLMGILKKAKCNEGYAYTRTSGSGGVDPVGLIQQPVVTPAQFSMNVPVVKRQEVGHSPFPQLAPACVYRCDTSSSRHLYGIAKATHWPIGTIQAWTDIKQYV